MSGSGKGSDTGEGSGWVVKPSETAVRVSLEFAHDAPISPGLRDALENLVRVIEDQPRSEDDQADRPSEDETEGFQVFRPRCPTRCPSQTRCDPLTSTPCFALTITDCTIQACPGYLGK